MDGNTQDLLEDLSGEAVFDSQGEFQVDLARAREKLEQHLGLWPEDYLAFLIQGAFALGAGRLRLSSGVGSVIWEFDGPVLTRPQLEAVLSDDHSQAVSAGLQRLQMAFFLLAKSRYQRYAFSSGLAGQGYRLQWKRGKASLRACAYRGSWSNRLELNLPLKHISVHWLLSRTNALKTLPEYASVRPRFKDGPLRLQLPWERRVDKIEETVPLVIAIQGRQRMAVESPLAAVHEYRLEADTEYSVWFATRTQGSLRCLVYSLGYPGPDWAYGAVWLYYDGLRTDLSQRQLVVGPRLQALLSDLESRLAEALGDALKHAQARHDCLNWILHGLSHWISSGGVVGRALARLPLFKMAFHDDFSLVQLDAIYHERQQVLYFCTEVPAFQPSEAPPVVVLLPEVASILRTRFGDLKPCSELFAQLQVRESNRQQWELRTPEALELKGVARLFPIQSLDPVPGIQGQPSPWQGQVGLMSSEVAPRLDVFKAGKWLASVALWQRFPKGLVGKVEHPDLEVNSNWTEPTGALWTSFLNELWTRMPLWIADMLTDQPEPWLVERAYELMLAHAESGPLENLPLVPLGERRVSLKECRLALADQSLPHWILQGWVPRERARLLTKLVQEDELRHWKKRLEIYQRGFDYWKVTQQRTVSLPNLQDVVCSLPLDQQRGEIGLRPLQFNTVQIFSFREGRRLGSNTLPGIPRALGGLPEGLVVAIDHPGLLPNGDWSEAVLEGEAWTEALGWIWHRLPDLLAPLMESDYPEKSLLALRLLGWIPRPDWPALPERGEFCQRMDGQSLSLAAAVALLQDGPPVRILTDPGKVKCFAGFESVWMLTHSLHSELASLMGPSRLQEAESDYLAAMLAEEHGQRAREEVQLGPHPWLLIESMEQGQLGLRRATGPANRCHLRLLRQGQLLLQHSWPLCSGPEHTSHFQMEAVVDWPEAPVVADFQRLWDEPAGRGWLQNLHQRLRKFGFSPPHPDREFLWERLAYEAGARDSGNVGFTLELDEVKLGLLKVPLFPMEGKLWTLEEIYQYLREESRLGYVLGDPLEVGAGPIVYLNAHELHWLKLLLGHSQLANLSHLRKALRARQQVAEAPRLTELPLPDLDYLVKRSEGHRCWGLQREMNNPSRVRVLRKMRVVDALSFDWRYQVQACLNLDQLQLNQDGSIRRDQEFQKAIDDLKADIQSAIVSETPAGYRLEVALWTWGVQEDWADQLHAQPLLRDPRGQDVSLRQWVDAWELDEGKLPYLLEGDRWADQADLLPGRPVPLLPSALVSVASRMMRGLMDYREGLRLAWQWVHQSVPQSAAPASYQWENGPLSVSAEYYWTEQQLVVRWRGRIVHQQSRKQWPGYTLEVDWSERLLGQPWPGWDEVTPVLSPYWRYLHNLLQQPDLLDQNLERWEALPVEAVAGPITLFFDPTEDDLRLLLARRKAEWRRLARGHFAPIQVACEHWWGCPVEVEPEESQWPLRVVEAEGQRRLYINLQHRWFRGKSPEVMAVRVCYWLQCQSGGRESLQRRNKILQALGLLDNPA